MADDTILSRIQTDMTAAMKSREAATLSTLRMLKTALMEARTRKPRDASLTADEEIEVLQRYAKKRREAIEEFRKLGRDDLVASEEKEIAVTAAYLPQGLGDDELRALIREAIAATGAAGPKDTGKVIGAVMAKAKGRVEGGTVSRLVKEALAGA
ncbi:MAG: GatB/YqeY domain-containing protein [Candidatus Eisenbacteria bacterium]|uniref:GatB/YqeY domain-containing protein n=1 Tax=Eiseniibacteriota bacterium TaxID=2212470 RepID=A0A9D6QJR7_UNCEI|nr:GatB/YqeY domain-containing protein [Candidatus Eisenbacteria bacterium]MBI3539540.1 GatB/YqeY domain-containing protein [Candidatus Eisenbacteria bacterium]